MFILLVLIYLHLICCVFFRLSTQRSWVRWLLILYPPAWMLFLFWIPLDIMQAIFWISAGVAFLFSTVSLFFQFSRIIFCFYTKKAQIPFFKMRLLRPAITIVIFLLACFSLRLSLRAADRYAVQKAKEIQAKVNVEKKCSRVFEEWPEEGLMYGRFGTKYPIMYYLSNEDPNTFIIFVRHSIDDGFYIKGGIDRELDVYVLFEGNKITKDLEDY
ncbi:MAG: hypothetical protein ABFD91_13240 [Anaerohalosphaeraceae bacterium]